jgi:acyl dehydratase
VEKLSIKELEINKKIDIGTVTLSEQDIIDYAKLNDPLDFHIDRKAAEQSIFKGFVASGSQIFNLLHKTGWIPLVGHTVICGMELNHWKFLRPVYANQPIKGTATPIMINPNKEKGHTVVVWKYEFTDIQNHLVQTLEVTVLHKL